MKRLSLIFLPLLCLIAASCYLVREEKRPLEKVMEKYEDDVHELYREVLLIHAMIQEARSANLIREQFKKARLAYKKTEWLAEYYYSYTAKHINGPPIDEVEADEKNIVIHPEGFQVIEGLLYPEYDSSKKMDLLRQVSILQSNINRLRQQASSLETTDAHVFDALRLQVFRIIALGISGFDAPLAKNSIKEAAVSLECVKKCVNFYFPDLKSGNNELAEEVRFLFNETDEYLSLNLDFDQFNRAEFIKNYANKVSAYLLAVQQQLSIPLFTEPRALTASAAHLFSENIFNTDFYGPGAGAPINAEKVRLGKQLFNDEILSGNNKVSCRTCHQPARAFTDGLKKSLAIDGKQTLKRNAPTLINAALQPALFYDGRVVYLEDQASDVILNKDEMHGSFEKALSNLKKNDNYRKHFAAAYAGEEISAWHIKNALASYLRSLVALDSRFDKYMRGDELSLNKNEIDGFNVFMGKGKCGSCHFLPLFSGVIAPDFSRVESEVIGVPVNSDSVHPLPDTDPGKYNVYKVELHKNAFKTPTLRNISLTAPYMHNGVYNTLDEVIAFYNKGGGGGLGFKSDNLTLPAEKLHLSEYEKKALILFMGTLTDTVTTR